MEQVQIGIIGGSGLYDMADVTDRKDVTLTTPLERLPTVVADLYETTLAFEGKSVRFPEHLEDALGELVTREGPFVATDLPGLPDDESRLVLVRRLVREGFLRRSGAASA